MQYQQMFHLKVDEQNSGDLKVIKSDFEPGPLKILKSFHFLLCFVGGGGEGVKLELNVLGHVMHCLLLTSRIINSVTYP